MKMYYLQDRLNKLSKQFENSPTKLQLIEELKLQLLEESKLQLLEFDNLPRILSVSLKNHYSHRLLKQIMLEIGYSVQHKPNCSDFVSFKITKKSK